MTTINTVRRIRFWPTLSRMKRLNKFLFFGGSDHDVGYLNGGQRQVWNSLDRHVKIGFGSGPRRRTETRSRFPSFSQRRQLYANCMLPFSRSRGNIMPLMKMLWSARKSTRPGPALPPTANASGGCGFQRPPCRTSQLESQASVGSELEFMVLGRLVATGRSVSKTEPLASLVTNGHSAKSPYAELASQRGHGFPKRRTK